MKFINYVTALAITALCHCWISGAFFPAIDIFFSSYKNKCTFFRSNFCRCWTFYRQPNRSSEFILINHPNCRWHAFWLWCAFILNVSLMYACICCVNISQQCDQYHWLFVMHQFENAKKYAWQCQIAVGLKRNAIIGNF